MERKKTLRCQQCKAPIEGEYHPVTEEENRRENTLTKHKYRDLSNSQVLYLLIANTEEKLQMIRRLDS